MARRSTPSLLMIAFCFPLLPAFSCSSLEQDPVNQAAAKVAGHQGQGGILVQSGDPGDKSTIALMIEDPETSEVTKVCTGSIISPTQVLTAAHCIRDTLQDGVYTGLKYIYLGLDLTQPTVEKRKIKRALFHQQYGLKNKDYMETKKRLGFAPEPDDKDYHDIGLLEIEGQWPEGYEPISLVSTTETVKEGAEIRILGYGKIEANQPDDNMVLRYGVMKSNSPRGNYDFTASTIAPEHYNPCYGDSGGPALIQENGTWKLAGIISSLGNQGDSESCEGAGAIFTLVPAFKDWIQSASERMAILAKEEAPLVEMAHPLDETSEGFQSFLAHCDAATPGSSEEHTYNILKAVAHQTTCLNTARVMFGFTHLTLDFTAAIALGDFYYGQYLLGDIATIPITSVQPFVDLSNLTVLSLAGHGITNLQPLGAMINQLRSLDLHGNSLTSEQLKTLASPQQSQLVYLDLAENALTRLEGIEGWIKLQSLNLRRNQINDLSSLSQLSDLLLLDAEQNQISDLVPLSSLNRLAILNLGLNIIQDLSPLSALINLVGLDLKKNRFTDITPLKSLQSLFFLDLSGNSQLQDPTCPLSETPEHKICYF